LQFISPAGSGGLGALAQLLPAWSVPLGPIDDLPLVSCFHVTRKGDTQARQIAVHDAASNGPLTAWQ
jgi:hypothetical protein